MFCSRSCANARIHGPDTRERIRSSLVGRRVTPANHILRGDDHPKRRGKFLPPVEDHTGVCLHCGDVYSYRGALKRKFCSRSCHHASVVVTDPYRNYKHQCQFRFNVYDYPMWFDVSLIDAYGWYTASNRGGNLDGVSRDHRYSVRAGFENNVNPALISHPANCMLILQRLNSRKHIRCSITVDELHRSIEDFETMYGPVAELVTHRIANPSFPNRM